MAPPKWTTYVQRTTHLPPIDFTIELMHYEPPRSGHLSTPNNKHWLVPDVPWPIISENGQWSYTHIMRMLVNWFRNATVTRFKDWELLLIVLVLLVSVKQWRDPKMRLASWSYITMPTGSITNAYNGYRRIPDLQQWSFPLFSEMKTFCYKQQSSVHL